MHEISFESRINKSDRELSTEFWMEYISIFLILDIEEEIYAMLELLTTTCLWLHHLYWQSYNPVFTYNHITRIFS